jgi:hypothetical protein
MVYYKIKRTAGQNTMANRYKPEYDTYECIGHVEPDYPPDGDRYDYVPHDRYVESDFSVSAPKTYGAIVDYIEHEMLGVLLDKLN